MRLLLSLAAVSLALASPAPARAQGMPGATVGLPMGSPDPFGLSTVNRPAGAAEPSAGSLAEPGMDPSERRVIRQPRRFESHRRAAPRRRAPSARR